jgi:hypothetical protein
LVLEAGCFLNVNAAAATYDGVGHDKVGAFHVIPLAIRRVDLLVISDIPPLRADLIGVNAVPITPEIVLHMVNLVAGVIRPRAQEILLRLGVKLF